MQARASGFGVSPEKYHVVFHVYGKDGVMGAAEPVKHIASHELGIVVEVVAPDAEDAKAVLAIARVVIPKVDFPGRLCKSGNMAFPFSPSDISVGPTVPLLDFSRGQARQPLLDVSDRLRGGALIMAKLSEIAKVCKSKNAGPFEVTIDVMFDSREMYDKVLKSGVLCEQLFATL